MGRDKRIKLKRVKLIQFSQILGLGEQEGDLRDQSVIFRELFHTKLRRTSLMQFLQLNTLSATFLMLLNFNKLAGQIHKLPKPKPKPKLLPNSSFQDSIIHAGGWQNPN